MDRGDSDVTLVKVYVPSAPNQSSTPELPAGFFCYGIYIPVVPALDTNLSGLTNYSEKILYNSETIWRQRPSNPHQREVGKWRRYSSRESHFMSGFRDPRCFQMLGHWQRVNLQVHAFSCVLWVCYICMLFMARLSVLQKTRTEGFQSLASS